MSAGRPLLAARTSSGDATKDGGNTSPGGGRQPGGRPKRTLIESACSACRRRKSRCDGVRYGRSAVESSMKHTTHHAITGRHAHDVKIYVPTVTTRQRRAKVAGPHSGAETKFSKPSETSSGS
ncbi:hypothetical protein PRZ48_004900 [Zasmidium cellare]|uniref:Zn(2)-C6 fungal-type domain-containing protein n=1 Tax=Zasmidium cellare TaxID=395010 RepID=A0ABR0ES65_ZASCE|nr:hypothetical protein PRZ48_004900 [Zasmidium cellare]